MLHHSGHLLFRDFCKQPESEIAYTAGDALAAKAKTPTLDACLANPAELAAYTEGREVIDLIRAYPVPWTPEEFVAALRPLQGRAYSISSSPKPIPARCISASPP